MVQVKKEAVRQRILDAAEVLFEEKGYVGASMTQIAARAKLGVASIYVYYPAKIDIAYAIFEPWIKVRLEVLAAKAMKMQDPERRLRFVLKTLWHDLPREQNSFFNNFIQAIAVADPQEDYKPSVLNHMQSEIRLLMETCMSNRQRSRTDCDALANLVVMAFDGFVINAHLQANKKTIEQTIGAMMSLVETA